MKVYNDNYRFNSDRISMDTVFIWVIYFPDICNNLHSRKIYCYGSVRHIIKYENCRIFVERNSD
jgi:hypothetical protein